MFPRCKESSGRGHLRNVESSGGICDGVTHRDHTSYYSVIGSDQLESLLFWEAGRLASFAVDQDMLDSELAIVGEEIRIANVASHGGYPWTTAASALFGKENHAGGDHGIIEHLDRITPAAAEAFHRRWYTPNNLVLSIVGDVTAARVESAVNAAFGALSGPARDEPRRNKVIIAASSHVRHHAPRFAGTGVAIGLATPDVRTVPHAYVAHAVLTEVLNSSRIPRLKIKEPRLRSACVYFGFHGEWFNTSVSDLQVTQIVHEPGWLDAETAFDNELAVLSTDGPRPGELTRAVNALLLAHHRQLDSLATRAVAHGRFELLFPYLSGHAAVPQLLAAVSDSNLSTAATSMLVQPRVVVKLNGE